MVQVLRAPQRNPSFGERLNQGVGQGLQIGSQLMGEHVQKQQSEKQRAAISKLTGLDVSDIQDPKILQKIMELHGEGQNKASESASKLASNRGILRDLEKKRNLPEGSLEPYVNDVKLAETSTRPTKEKEPPLTAKKVPPETSRKINKILADNPNASSDKLRSIMDEEGVEPVYSNPYTENRRRTEEQGAKSKEERTRELRQETLPMRKQLAEKAFAAQKGIENKEQLLDIIERGDVDDPTFAAIAESLPLKLGKRLLSNDTVEYKAGLVEEFGDLRNIFQGQTRVKEIELLEEKIADLYLTDDQKKAILKSRINALKADTIRAEVAQEIENEPYGVLQFQQELDKRVKPRLEGLFNQILDEQKSIIQNAENKKKVALDFNDPDDKKIADAIIKEARGDRNEARKLAKKKGYTF